MTLAYLFILGPIGSWHVAVVLGLILVLVTVRQRRRVHSHEDAYKVLETRVRRRAIWRDRLRHPVRAIRG